MATETLTISPITTAEDGSYTWDVDGVSYWTSTDGQGLFIDTYREGEDPDGNIWSSGEVWHQIEGTAQFAIGHLSPEARRKAVIVYHVRHTESYTPWLVSNDETDTQANAQRFYQHLRQHEANPAWTCCQVMSEEEEAQMWAAAAKGELDF